MRIFLKFGLILLLGAFGCNEKKANLNQCFVGTFKVNLDSRKVDGKIELTNKTLQLQFPIADEILISSVDFDFKQEKREVEWICAVMMDKTVVRCSTEQRIFKTQRLFVDRGYYTVKFLFKELSFTDVVNIEILIKSNFGVQKISSTVNEVILNGSVKLTN